MIRALRETIRNYSPTSPPVEEQRETSVLKGEPMSKDITPFEKIRRRVEDHFVDITEMIAIDSGQRVEDHFVEIDQMVEIGSGAQRPLKAKS